MRRSRLKLLAICSALSLANNFQYGFSSTYFNTPVTTFKNYLNESMTKQGVVFDESTYSWMWNLLINIWFVGFFFGIWLSPLLNDKCGRKVGSTVGSAVSLFVSVIRFVAIITKLPELLFVGRIIASITAAVCYQSLILYLQECAPTHLRGMLSFTSEISYSSMCILGMLLGTDQVFGQRLDFLLGFAIIPSTLALIVLFPIPETPKFLYLTKNDRKGAVKSIMFFHGGDADVQLVLEEIEKEAEEDKNSSSLKEILTTPYLRKAIFLACLALQNTVALWAILLSSTDFLRRVNLDNDFSAWSSTAMTVMYACGTAVGFVIVERLPRRVLILSFTSVNVVLLVLFVIFAALNSLLDGTKYGCLICLLAYGFTYGAGVGPVSWIMCTELVPQRHRSLVQSLCYSVNTIMVVISTFTILPLYEAVGAYAILILYIGPSAFSIFYMFRNLPETSGREIYAIVRDLKGSQNDSEEASNSSAPLEKY